MKLNSDFNMSMFNSYDVDDDAAKTVQQSSNAFVIQDPSRDLTITVTGDNFTYNQWGVNGGTFQSFEIQANRQKLFLAENIDAFAGYDDYQTGFKGYYGLTADLAYWMRDADTVYDGNGNETILVFSGNDLIIAGAGNDVIDGGKGSDTVQYAGNRQDFVVQQQGNAYTVSHHAFGFDTLTNVEFLKFNDQTFSMAEAIQNQPSNPNPTENFLQQKFQITMNDAMQWVIQHLATPQAIYDICANNGIGSDMLAEIVQPHFAHATLTGVAVNDWFAAQGFATLA